MEISMHFVEAKGILSAKNGMNIYRGCTHGCIYCDSRSKCYGFTHPFEDIEVKQNAPELLEKALRSKRKKCMIGTGAMCDPYMHCEEKLQFTRKCLEIIDHYEYGVAIQTKSNRILRDLDLLKSINEKSKCVVEITLTTYDEELCKILEPNVCTTRERFEMLQIMKENGIPTIVWLTPIEMGVTLREGDREYYYEALDRHFPGMKAKYQRRYGNAYDLPSDDNKELMELFHNTCKQHNMIHSVKGCFEYMNEYPEQFQQMTLF